MGIASFCNWEGNKLWKGPVEQTYSLTHIKQILQEVLDKGKRAIQEAVRVKDLKEHFLGCRSLVDTYFDQKQQTMFFVLAACMHPAYSSEWLFARDECQELNINYHPLSENQQLEPSQPPSLP